MYILPSLSLQTEPWKMVATLYNGTIYLQEMETEEKRQREEGMSAREKVMCYWGLKFEDYMTTKSIVIDIVTDNMIIIV